MKKFRNTKNDRLFLKRLIDKIGNVLAVAEFGYFENKSPKSYKKIRMQAFIKDVNLKSGVCSWSDYSCETMQDVSINCFYFLPYFYEWKCIYKKYFDIDFDINEILLEENELKIISESSIVPIVYDGSLRIKHLNNIFVDKSQLIEDNFTKGSFGLDSVIYKKRSEMNKFERLFFSLVEKEKK